MRQALHFARYLQKRRMVQNRICTATFGGSNKDHFQWWQPTRADGAVWHELCFLGKFTESSMKKNIEVWCGSFSSCSAASTSSVTTQGVVPNPPRTPPPPGFFLFISGPRCSVPRAHVSSRLRLRTLIPGRQPNVIGKLSLLGLRVSEAEELFALLDADASGEAGARVAARWRDGGGMRSGEKHAWLPPSAGKTVGICRQKCWDLPAKCGEPVEAPLKKTPSGRTGGIY